MDDLEFREDSEVESIGSFPASQRKVSRCDDVRFDGDLRFSAKAFPRSSDCEVERGANFCFSVWECSSFDGDRVL